MRKSFKELARTTEPGAAGRVEVFVRMAGRAGPVRAFALALVAICAATLPARTTKKTQEPDYSAFRHKLSKDDQVLHALDRLTFGPRRGEVESLRKMGLKK